MKPRRPLFQFQGFELYQAQPEDIWLARLWTNMDPWHHLTTRPEFWLESGMGVESYVLRDRQGWLYFARLERHNFKTPPAIAVPAVPMNAAGELAAVELHLQFGHANGSAYRATRDRGLTPIQALAKEPIGRDRMMSGLIHGMKWLELALSGTGTSALFFDSENPQLVRFCKKRLGFLQDGRTLLKWLVPSPVEQ